MAGRVLSAPQLVGLGVTLAAVAVYSGYTLRQVHALRHIQAETVDRGRRDALQLVRIQNDLYEIGLTLHEMSEAGPYPLTGYHGALERLRLDLQDALRQEHRLAPGSRTRDQQTLLEDSMRRFWDEMDRMWMLAGDARDNEARALIRTQLNAERTTLNSAVARLLVQNSAAETESADEIFRTYRSAEVNLYWFLAAVLMLIGTTGVNVIRFSRRAYERQERLSEERKMLAGNVIGVQEEVFRRLARELHDEFGQALTALGAMLQRVRKRIGADSPAQEDLAEIRAVAAATLERVRLMSQMLHPPVLDDYGLEKSLQWYLRQFEKQSGLMVHYEQSGHGPWIGDETAIQVYRILQEALNNVVRHAGVHEVWVRAGYSPAALRLEVEDHGVGLALSKAGGGMGLISMRERAGLVSASLEFEKPAQGGLRVVLEVPLRTGVTQ
jgi:signal transduction histidine kinase